MILLQISKQNRASLRQNSFVQGFLLREGVPPIFVSHTTQQIKFCCQQALLTFISQKQESMLTALNCGHSFAWSVFSFFPPEYIILL